MAELGLVYISARSFFVVSLVFEPLTLQPRTLHRTTQLKWGLQMWSPLSSVAKGTEKSGEILNPDPKNANL